MGQPAVGDQGQRYEIWVVWAGRRMRAGWADKKDTKFVRRLKRHPSITEIEIHDRESEAPPEKIKVSHFAGVKARRKRERRKKKRNRR